MSTAWTIGSGGFTESAASAARRIATPSSVRHSHDSSKSSAGDSILVRVQRPTDVPLESLHGQRDNLGRSLRLTVANVVPADSLGEFSLEAQQGDVSAVFVPLARLQQDLEIPGRVNTLLVSSGLSPPADAPAALRALVRREAQLEDLGYLVETSTRPECSWSARAPVSWTMRTRRRR